MRFNLASDMSSLKQIKLAQKAAGHHQQVISELSALVKDIERCEKTIVSLQKDLIAVNTKFQGKRNTREDVEYLFSYPSFTLPASNFTISISSMAALPQTNYI